MNNFLRIDASNGSYLIDTSVIKAAACREVQGTYVIITETSRLDFANKEEAFEAFGKLEEALNKNK